MIDDGLSNGIVGDLSEDILGSQSEYLKISNESITHETPDLDRVLESLSDRRDGQTTLIPNTEYRASSQDSQREAVDVQRQKREVIRSARWMHMQNEPDEKVKRYLEKFSDEGLLSHAEVEAIKSETPFHGQLYLDRNTASKCVDVRHASRKSAARQALWVIMAPGCELCKTVHGFCPESGKKLVADIPATKQELREACRHLMECGRILSDAKINDWGDLKKAMSPPEPSEMWGRVYPHASPVVEKSLPKMDARAQDEILKKAESQRVKNDAIVREAINGPEIRRVARLIGELLLKGTDLDLVRKEVERKFPDAVLIKAAIEFLHRVASSELLLTRIVASPALYDGDCHKCRKFLHENSVKVAAVLPIKQCKDCLQKDNTTRSCSIIGARIMEDGPSEADVNQAIDELKVKGRLSLGQVRGLKTNTDPRKRLIEAVRLAYGGEGKTKSEELVSRPESKNSLTLTTESSADRENAVLWAVGALAEAATANQVKAALKKKQSDAEEVVNDALVAAKTFRADPLDACMDDKYSSQDNMNQNNGETQEANAVREFFADSDLVVNVDADKTRKTIDIRFLNEGAEMTIDLGKNDSLGAITNYEQLYDLLPQNVDIGPKKTGEPPLNVQGLGAAEGLDLSGIF
jgi:hypothetical protein